MNSLLLITLITSLVLNASSSTPCATVFCPPDKVCVDDSGSAICEDLDNSNPCALVLCADGTMCVDGICVDQSGGNNADPCATVLCDADTYCVDGVCQAISDSTTTSTSTSDAWWLLAGTLADNQILFSGLNFNYYQFSSTKSGGLFAACSAIKRFITVNDDAVTDIIFESNDLNCNANDYMESDYLSINDWFDKLLGLILDRLFCNWGHEDSCPGAIKSLEIEYNHEYGYPTQISINKEDIPVDGGVIFNFDDFTTEYVDPSCAAVLCGPCQSCSNGICSDECDQFQECNYPTNECVGSIQTCGGLAGLSCEGNYECVDDPRDNCSPVCGGYECGGVCVKVWDDGNGNQQQCGGTLNLQCPDGFMCFIDPTTECDPVCGGVSCVGFCADPIQS